MLQTNCSISSPLEYLELGFSTTFWLVQEFRFRNLPPMCGEYSINDAQPMIMATDRVSSWGVKGLILSQRVLSFLIGDNMGHKLVSYNSHQNQLNGNFLGQFCIEYIH